MTSGFANWKLGQFVNIDNDKSIKAVITGFQFRGDKTTMFIIINVEWFSNGELRSAWVEEWRISEISEA